MAKQEYKEDRKKVSRLIYMVLAEKLHVREAILKFPKDINDKTIKAAYHALIHFESDEDFRKKDLIYKDIQNEYLEFIAQTLSFGEPLAQNIIKNYEKYYKKANTPYSKNMKGLIKSLCNFLNV
jgi:hypothetical protein